jgi:hypothetical protein
MPATSCNMPCAGATNETCGSSGLLDVYNTTGVYSGPDPKTGRIGCFGDVALMNGSTYASTLMSSSICAATCVRQGFPISGTFAGNTCRCGTADVVSKATLNDDGQCKTACAGVSTGEICGGLYAQSLSNASIAAGPSSSSSGNSTSSSNYIGCYNEGSTRTLSGYSYSSNTLTNKDCMNSCGSLGFKYS